MKEKTFIIGWAPRRRQEKQTVEIIDRVNSRASAGARLPSNVSRHVITDSVV